MPEIATLKAEQRDDTGKGAARQLRMKGRIPAVIYGRGREPQALSIAALELDKLLASMGSDARSTLISLSLDGKKRKTLIRDIQRHPVRPEVLHVDFYEIHARERITLEVPIHLVGSPDGVRNGGGVLDQVSREVQIQTLPEHIPEHVSVDVTELGLGKSLHMRDISIERAEILTAPDTTVCTVVPPRVEVEEAAPEVEVEEEIIEPEIIGKPKEPEESSAEEG